MSDEIKRVKRELKFKGKIIDFYQDTMEINGDHTVIWDFIKHKGAAAVVPVTDEGKILMVRQYRNALERYTLEIPAGALDTADEPGITCASRELEEETGYRSENLEWLINLRTTVAFCNEKIEVFVAKNLIPSKQHLDEDEFIDLGAYTMEELKEKIYSGEIEDAKTYIHNPPAYNEISDDRRKCLEEISYRKAYPYAFYAGLFIWYHLYKFYSETVCRGT